MESKEQDRQGFIVKGELTSRFDAPLGGGGGGGGGKSVNTYIGACV